MTSYEQVVATEPLQPKADAETTTSEVWGWYVYDFANSPYYQVYTVGIMPVFLLWLAQGYAAAHSTANVDRFMCDTVESGMTNPAHLPMPYIGITAGSFPVAVSLVTTALQILCLLSFSAFGDYGSNRYRLLKVLTWCGATCVVLNIFCLRPEMCWLAALVRIFAGACFVLCVAYYNAYLPILAANSPEVKEAQGEDYHQRYQQRMDSMSVRGTAVGYTGGAFLLLVSWVVHMSFECNPCEAQCSDFQVFLWPALCCSLVGLWWLVFSVYTFFTLQDRPGEELPEGGSMVCFGWREAFATMGAVVKYRQTLLFTLAYFIFSDCIGTLTTNAFLLLEERTSEAEGAVLLSELHMSWILAVVGALVGAFIYQAIQTCTGASAKTMILVQLGVYAIISLAIVGGALKVLPFQVVMAPAALSIGSIQAYTRAIYASLIPPGRESAMFSLYEITDKGSNFVGALITLVIHNFTHSYTESFWYLLLGFLASAALLCLVDVDKGVAEVGAGSCDSGSESPSAA